MTVGNAGESFGTTSTGAKWVVRSCQVSALSPINARAYDVELINDYTLEKRSYKGVTDFPLDHLASQLDQWVARQEPAIPDSFNAEQIAGIVSALRETYNSGVYDSGKYSRAWKNKLGNLLAIMLRVKESNVTLFALTPEEVSVLDFCLKGLVSRYDDGKIVEGLHRKFAAVIGGRSE